MNLHRKIILPLALALAWLGSARAADLTGQWQADFDSQIGPQKYLFTLKQDGDKLTGTAAYERQDQKGETKLTDGTFKDGDVSFVEAVKIQDQDVRIEYHGKYTGGDELKLTRKVGDFATYDIVAKRVMENKETKP